MLHRLTAFMLSLLRLISTESPATLLQVTFLLHLPAHGGVPVVFDRVVCPEKKIDVSNATVNCGGIVHPKVSHSDSAGFVLSVYKDHSPSVIPSRQQL